MCFDCRAKVRRSPVPFENVAHRVLDSLQNPTWSSVTFGVYICLDCSRCVFVALVACLSAYGVTDSRSLDLAVFTEMLVFTSPLFGKLGSTRGHEICSFGIARRLSTRGMLPLPGQRALHQEITNPSRSSSSNSSTNLDIWYWKQLRTMKVGGNAAFSDFLARHPGSSSNSSDTKEKYMLRAAGLYKEELAKKMAEDERLYGPNLVVIEGAQAAAATAAGAAGATDDNFFDTWDAPKKAPAPLAPSTASPLISFGLSPGNTPLNSRPSSPRVPSPGGTVPAAAAAPKPAAAPRTITSSSLRTSSATASASTGTARAKPSLGSRTSSTGSGAAPAAPVGRAKLGGKLGGVKKGGTVNFEEAERKAREEEERIKQLGYDERQERETAAKLEQERVAASRNGSSGGGYGSSKPAAGKKDGETERLGMGFKKLGFGQTMGMGGEESAREYAKAQKAAERKASGYDDRPGEPFATPAVAGTAALMFHRF